MFNPSVTIEQTRPLDGEPWQPVSPRYATLLRCYLLIYGLLFSGAPWLVRSFEQASTDWVMPVSGTLVLVFISAMIFWVPRRVRHTRYLLRLRDVHMQTGLLWRRTTSVAINRIQHLEITQGPIERGLGLSRLVVYTAGGMKSDLVLPGVTTDTAKRLKVRILAAAEYNPDQEGEQPTELKAKYQAEQEGTDEFGE